MTKRVIRLIELGLCALFFLVTCPMWVLLVIINVLTNAKLFFFQRRLGQNRKSFTLVKFRTMRLDTPNVASHKVDPQMVSMFGRFLRKTKFDELPQLWNVLCGDMSLVGPRPCLENQHDVIEARNSLGVFQSKPGITGLAQIQQIDMSTPDLLASVDRQMIDNLDLKMYFGLIIKTALGKGVGDGVRLR